MITVEVDAKSIGDRIKKVRESVGLSQPKFGSRYNMTKNQLIYIEQGRKEKEGDLILFCERVAEKEGVNLDWLLTGKGEMTEQTNRYFGGVEDTEFNIRELERQYGSGDMSPDEIIKKYFEIYSGRKEKLAELIRSGKIDLVFKLVE